jgi:tetratricopeptide (TPR) repeat protein
LGNEAFSKLKYSEAISLYDQAERDAGSGSETARKAIFNSALAYEAMGDGTMAMKRYRAALSAGYAASDIYRYIASLQSRKGELNGAINTIKEGRTKFPDDKDLMLDEMSYYLSAGRSVEAEESVKSSIQKNPNSAVLWFVLASLYDKRAFETNDEIAMNEWYNKAEQAYKRSIELDPKFFDSNFNMGVLYNNRAAYEYEKCNVINKDALYTKCKREADEVYVKALPYFESAHDLRPDDKQVIGQLMKLYAKTGEQVKYEAMKRKQ